MRWWTAQSAEGRFGSLVLACPFHRASNTTPGMAALAWLPARSLIPEPELL
jgi:hypothetical protein